MKKTKLIIAVAMILIICVSAFALVGCKKEDNAITIAMPDGASALALAKLMRDTKDLDGYSITYAIRDGSTGIKSVVMSGEADIALLPMNMAAQLFNGGIDIRLVGVNVFGLLYLVGDDLLEGYESLKGEVVYNVGQGGTPDFVFKKILSANNIEYIESNTAEAGKVALAYMSPAELVPKLKTGIINYAVLGEPQATLAISGTNNQVLLDLQEEWKTVTESDTLGYSQVGMVVKNSLLEKNPNLVKDIVNLVIENAEWILDNPKEAGNIIRDNEGTMPIELTRDVVERCNIAFSDAINEKANIISYLSVLKDFAPQSIGGALPSDNFYYGFD